MKTFILIIVSLTLIVYGMLVNQPVEQKVPLQTMVAPYTEEPVPTVTPTPTLLPYPASVEVTPIPYPYPNDNDVDIFRMILRFLGIR